MAQQQHKMNVVQLTFIVAVNMMGSGIIMLPTNMARVGAISLLSWLVTAVGSMAIAYGFAQAGILNQREGGMAAYAEDAYGRSGYFQVFFLYFLSVAIANVAVASSALGYLAAFVPALTASPLNTCIGVIALLWLTTAANFGGPRLTGRIGSITVWGVILPVGFISLFGWFWFKGATFEQAWNPNGLSLLHGMGSSISLTLWAFLGMESAVQNSSAVENPKRDVPLACLFGTLGAAVIYVLSTWVIQGIVPNAELAKSTGPFGLAYAKMIGPLAGHVVMALAVLACVGSLLGWQFTLAQTAKDAADNQLFPAVFSKVTPSGAPLAGMVMMCIVQSLMALSTISPNLSEQFAALVNLAVVTNVVPYIISLSALFVMMRDAGTPARVYLRNALVTVVALVYSIYALYASGKDAVLGGMLVIALGYVVYGLIAARAAAQPAARRPGAAAAGPAALLILLGALALAGSNRAHAAAPGVAAAGANTSALARIRQTATVRLGFIDAAQPFAWRDAAGQPTGYTIALCRKIVDALHGEPGMPKLALQWVPLALEDRKSALESRRVDLLCGTYDTLAARRQASFSIPVYPGGIGVLVRRDSSQGLRDLLNGTRSALLWRGAPSQILSQQTIAVIAGAEAEAWVRKRLNELHIDARLVTVQDVTAGVASVVDRRVNAFFAERALLVSLARTSPAADQLLVLERRFTDASIAIGVARGDDDLRLIVDRTLSELFVSPDLNNLYSRWFGPMDARTRAFFRQSAIAPG
ncbi:putrescine-ornithine antiporter [Burkholderia sp. SRS-W-2-2016]|uniref:putrescine-ornithine antiporter n=1 Tax=Burkholderia sp. SRS-W-2-2016 TaxID=1926878 RepID=UPI00094B75CE|nr:putrescine-ornithine antiporter [Burkholderia sp. SRS-W-2-2016]OLL31182.1 putrescine-ornithine antiporter [Burkholderia sp. SRS-W-2-2016]